MRGLYRSAALGLAQAYDFVRWSREHATVDTLRKLPNDLSLCRVGIIGGGGCGKTTIMQKVGVPTLATFFSRGVLTAPSNRAARGFDPRAKAMHSIAGMKPTDSMRTSSLHIKTDQMRKRMDANQTHAGAWVHDEALQTASFLLQAASLRITYARHDVYKLDIARYAEPSEIFGRICSSRSAVTTYNCRLCRKALVSLRR